MEPSLDIRTLAPPTRRARIPSIHLRGLSLHPPGTPRPLPPLTSGKIEKWDLKRWRLQDSLSRTLSSTNLHGSTQNTTTGKTPEPRGTECTPVTGTGTGTGNPLDARRKPLVSLEQRRPVRCVVLAVGLLSGIASITNGLGKPKKYPFAVVTASRLPSKHLLATSTKATQELKRKKKRRAKSDDV
jgi:hypothetical protein